MRHDLRLAFRSLLRRPAFAATAVLLLALGAGANAAVFSLVRGVLLQPLPFGAPDRLAVIWPGEYVSNEVIGVWRDRARSVEAVAGIAPGWLMALVADGGDAQKVTGARVSDNLFALLRVEAALGRAIAPGDGVPGRDRVTVISDRLWRQRFAGDPQILGRSVLVDEQPFEVIGVMPDTFELLGQRTDLWVPLPFAPGTPGHATGMSQALGRLRHGVSIDAATADLVALVPEMRRAMNKPADWGRTMRAQDLRDATTGPVRVALTLLLAAVGLVLLLGAVNLGTLVLGRSIERARELAVRTAIGGSRGRLLRQLVVEQAVLALIGALAGLALAQMLLPAIVAQLPAEVPRQREIALDLVVFVTVLTSAVALAVAMALVPAIVALRPGLQPLLRQHQSTDTPGRQRALGALVAAQVALAVVLGIGSGLMLRSMWHLQRVDPGFDPNGVLTFRLQTTSKYRALSTGLPYLQQVRDRIAAVPGVTGVGAAAHLPMSGYAWTIPVHRVDAPPAPGTGAPMVGWRFVWADYFGVMRIPVLAGRVFDASDRTGGAAVAVLNERLARTLFGSPASAVGQRLVQKGGGRAGDTVVEVVGVVGDVRHKGLDTRPMPEYFTPLAQTFMFPMQMVVRVDGDPAAVVAAVRHAGVEVDATVPVAELQPLTAMLAATLGRSRLLAALLTIFAAAGLLLSVVGLYGVVAVRVRQREREIGIRMALGATAGRMASAVVRQGVTHALVGVLLGVPAALGLARFMESLVFGITTRDPWTFGALPVVLTIAAALACYLPARRAARVDPAIAIKEGGA